MADFIDIDLEKKEESKKNRFVRRAKEKFNDGKAWVGRNKEALIVFGPMIIGGLASTIKVAGKHNNLKKEEKLKDLYCYDRSMGHYWRLRRKLSNKEWLAVERKRKNGERIGDILKDMKVLK